MGGTSSIHGLDEKAIGNLVAQSKWNIILGDIAINNRINRRLTQLYICVLETNTCLRPYAPSSGLFIKN
jgi:hypothetical protein